MCVHCKYTGVYVCMRERHCLNVLWCIWQQEDIWNLGIRVVFVEKKHSGNLCFIFKSCVSYPPPLLLKERFLTFVFNHLSRMFTFRAAEKSHPTCDYRCSHKGLQTIETGRLFLYLRVNMTFLAQSQRGAVWILSESSGKCILPIHLLLWFIVQAVKVR